MRRFKQPFFFIEDPEAPGSGGGSGGGAPPPASPWPDNWREQASGGDEDKLGRLSRYQSIPDVVDALVASQNKVRSGEYREVKPFPAEGSDEEKNSWRQANGIPLKAEDYGFEVSKEDDKPLADMISKFAYENNLSSDAAKSVYSFLIEQENTDLESEKEADLYLQQKAEDKLHAEWGNEYRRNINIINGLLDSAGADVKTALENARDDKGQLLKHNVGLQKFLVSMALLQNPMSSVMPMSQGGFQGTYEDRISEIKRWMGAPKGSADYNKYWKDDRVQKEYLQLVEYRQKQSA
jgi:hypothetical protein